MIHYAKLEKSERLQRILRLLKERGSRGATSREIDRECDTVCAHTGIAELRSNGIRVKPAVIEQDGLGRRIFRYVLETEVANEPTFRLE